jgi:hypothetical protein
MSRIVSKNKINARTLTFASNFPSPKSLNFHPVMTPTLWTVSLSSSSPKYSVWPYMWYFSKKGLAWRSHLNLPLAPFNQPIPRFSRGAEAEAIGWAVAKSASQTKRIKRPLKNCILIDRVRYPWWDGCGDGVDIGCERAG